MLSAKSFSAAKAAIQLNFEHTRWALLVQILNDVKFSSLLFNNNKIP